MSKEMLTAASALLDYVSNHHRRLSSEFVSQGHNTSSTIHGFKRYDDTTVSQTTVLFVAAGLAFFTWRLWKFSLRPRLWPSEPLELPYWLPCTWKEGQTKDHLLTTVGDIGITTPR